MSKRRDLEQALAQERHNLQALQAVARRAPLPEADEKIRQGHQDRVNWLQQKLLELDIGGSDERVSKASQEASERRKSQNEDSGFWFRRFVIALSIANAASFGALATGYIQGKSWPALAQGVAGTMTLFAVGMVASGMVPILLSLQVYIADWDRWRRRWWRFGVAFLTGFSATLFILGLYAAIQIVGAIEASKPKTAPSATPGFGAVQKPVPRPVA